MHKRALLFLIGIGVVAAAAEGREGFGFTKKAVTMNRTKPPATNLGARRVSITATSDRAAEADDATTLQRYTEEVILSGAGTMASGKDKGDVRVNIMLDRLDSHEAWETKTETRYQKVGSHQEWNEKKKKYETKDDYANVPYTVQVKVLTGSLTGTFDIADKSGKIVDSENLSTEYREKFEEGKNAPTPSKVEDELLRRAATAIAGRLVPTQDRVSVIVPKGSFESVIPLADMNAWDRYLESVQAVREHRDARQESYRQYALALAKEGLAYATDNRARAVELLREAVGHYQTAIRSNPGEKIFSETYSSLFSTGSTGASLPRAQASLTAFEAWTGAGRPQRVLTAESPARDTVLTNQVLIEMSKAGLTEENLILAIDAASETDFDTSPTALIALAKAGVSKNVIARMQKKQARK
jgi:hypothetical protein